MLGLAYTAAKQLNEATHAYQKACEQGLGIACAELGDVFVALNAPKKAKAAHQLGIDLLRPDCFRNARIISCQIYANTMREVFDDEVEAKRAIAVACSKSPRHCEAKKETPPNRPSSSSSTASSTSQDMRIQGPLSASEIHIAFSKGRRDFSVCAAQSMSSADRYPIQFKIGADGFVEQAMAQDSDPTTAPISRCFASFIRKLVFPKAVSSTVVRHAFAVGGSSFLMPESISRIRVRSTDSSSLDDHARNQVVESLRIEFLKRNKELAACSSNSKRGTAATMEFEIGSEGRIEALDVPVVTPKTERCLVAVLNKARLAPLKATVSLQATLTEFRGSLSRADIQKVIRAKLRPIKACYEKELRQTPALAGEIVVKFKIEGDGTVADVVLVAPEGFEPVSKCLEGIVRKMVFPPPKGGGIVFVNYPFVFSSSP